MQSHKDKLITLRNKFKEIWNELIQDVRILGNATDKHEHKSKLLEILEEAHRVRDELTNSGDFIDGVSKLEYELDESDRLERILEQFDNIIKDIESLQKSSNCSNKKYDLFWVDPAFAEGPDKHTSGLCEVVVWPKECLELKCYSKLEYEDYEHCNNEDQYGLELGSFDCEKTCLESFENIWFETIEQREEYIKESGFLLDVEKIEEYLEDEKYYKDLRNYSPDTIFYIKKEDGGEAEVFGSELWQLVEEDNIMSFVNIQVEEDGDIRLSHSPKLKDGTMSPYSIDYDYIVQKHLHLPINLLVKLYHLKTNYTGDVRFDFIGNDDIEAFYARIESFKLDTDNSIIATIVDMEDEYFDVAWEEIKNSEFDI